MSSQKKYARDVGVRSQIRPSTIIETCYSLDKDCDVRFSGEE